MNEKKIISYLMMQTLKATCKGLDELKKPYEDMDLEIVKVQFKSIKYYAEMIIEKDGAL